MSTDRIILDRTILSASYGGITVSVWYDRRDDTRYQFAYRFTDPDGTTIFDGADLRSGSVPYGTSFDLPAMLRTLLHFLSAWAESGEDGENADLFDPAQRHLVDWADLAETLLMDLGGTDD